MGEPRLSTDTVYFDLKVTVPAPQEEQEEEYLQNLIYNLEVHYHPANRTRNYLHIKKSQGSDSGNEVAPENWLIDLNQLRRGKDAWNEAHTNDGRRSTHNF